jgi:hypothetical protein
MVKISELPSGGSLSSTEPLVANVAGVTSQVLDNGVRTVILGGTGQSTYTDGQLLIGNSATGGLTKAALTAGAGITITNGNGSISIAGDTAVGSVTSVSVVSANGLAGTVATPTSTPAITLSTTITGILKGNATAISAATSGTDYVAPGGALGTPSSGTLTNCTGLPFSSLASATNTTGALVVGTGSSLAASGSGTITATAVPASGITGTTLASGVVTSSLTSIGSQAQALNMNSHQINNVTDPTSAQDAATKNYVDLAINGLSPKASVRLATAAALATNTYNNGSSGVGATLTGVATGVLTVDGSTVNLNDRLWVKNEVAGANNGIYICTVAGAGGVAYVLTRTTDANTSAELIGAYAYVEAGTANATTTWAISNTSAITIGSTAITIVQISGPGTYTNGTGLSLTGNQFSIANTAVTAASYGSATASPTYTVNAQGQLTAALNVTITPAVGSITGLGTSVATALGVNVGSAGAFVTNGGALGTPSSGTLTNCTGLPVAGGGTGAATLTGVLKGNGTSAFTAATAGTDYVAPGTVTSFTAQQNFTAVSTASSSNLTAWNLSTAQSAYQAMLENTTLSNPSNAVNGGTYVFQFIQNASAAKTLAFGTNYIWDAGGAPTISTTLSSVLICTFISDGTKMRGGFKQYAS